MEEKYKGKIKAEDVVSISIEDIRLGGPPKVEKILKSLSNQTVCIVNAMDMTDLHVFTLGLLRAERKGSKFSYRTAASFVKARIGQSEYPFLTRDEIVNHDSNGALLIVGSHVPGTTLQLNKLIKSTDINPIELNVHKILKGDYEEKLIIKQIDESLCNGEDLQQNSKGVNNLDDFLLTDEKFEDKKNREELEDLDKLGLESIGGFEESIDSKSDQEIKSMVQDSFKVEKELEDPGIDELEELSTQMGELEEEEIEEGL